jgi:RecA/RadA recombinase
MIGARAFLGIGGLPGQDIFEFFSGHAGTGKHAAALFISGGGDDDNAVDPR